MDSRLIHKATSHLKYKVDWGDWIHFGTGVETNLDLVKEEIQRHLPDRNILLAHHRLDSEETKGDEILKRIEPLLGKDDFQIWNVSMDKVIDFSRIGVLRLGRKVDPNM